jgi:hypothetical protein
MNKGKESLKIFLENIESVNRLANFDRVVLDYSIKAIEKLQNNLSIKFKNEALLATGTLKQLTLIREHDSMRNQYKEIFNQCVVLLVSYFGSAVSEIFKIYITSNISTLKNKKAFTEEFKFSPKEMSEYNFNLLAHIGEIIVSKKNISFQDMKSINRSFRDFLDIPIDKDSTVNDIIIGQACRHIIVHSGSLVNSQMLKQISNADPRSLNPKIKLNSKIQFEPEGMFREAELGFESFVGLSRF